MIFKKRCLMFIIHGLAKKEKKEKGGREGGS